jgi:Cu-Zn family superoxide dismutase
MAECFERKAKGKLRSYRMKMTHRIHGLTVGVLGLLLSACVPSNPFTEGRARVADTGAKAQFVDAKGQWLGTLTISPQSGGGVRLTGWLVELPAGVHGINIHENGKCDPPDYKSAGAHFSPTGRQHGFNPMGPHEGDLGNLRVYLSGITPISLLAELVTLEPGANSLFKPGGTSLVITSRADDQKTDPTGDSGDRIACGVITR